MASLTKEQIRDEVISRKFTYYGHTPLRELRAFLEPRIVATNESDAGYDARTIYHWMKRAETLIDRLREGERERLYEEYGPGRMRSGPCLFKY